MHKREIPFGADKLLVHTLGAGPPLLFVHGWPLHALTFAAVAERLAAVRSPRASAARASPSGSRVRTAARGSSAG